MATRMILDLLPSNVVAVETCDELAPIPLFAEEEAVIAGAVEKRRNEFTTVRACARLALARLGSPSVPLVPGRRGAPSWPPGVVGSMTHCAGYRAAAVAWCREVRSIGLDAEPDAALPDGVLAKAALPSEAARLRELRATDPSIAWDRLLFCAKESVYKAWYPLTERWLDFDEVSVDLDPSGVFTARLHVAAPIPGFTGRWLARDALLLTAIADLA